MSEHLSPFTPQEASLRGFDARAGGIEGSVNEIAQKKGPDGEIISIVQAYDTEGNEVGAPHEISQESFDRFTMQDIEKGRGGKFNKSLGAVAMSDAKWARWGEATPVDIPEPDIEHPMIPVNNPVETSRSPEVKIDPRMAELFQPYTRPETAEANLGFNKYEVLFEQDPARAAEMQAKIDEANKANEPVLEQQKEYDRLVTESSKHDALFELHSVFNRDPALRAIFSAHNIENITDNAVDMVREDPSLRYEIGAYFTKKLDTLLNENVHAFGRRLYLNSDKSPDSRRFLPVQNMKSREYAALLALSMIDGSFNKGRITSTDEIAKNSRGEMIGQHRHAAQTLLDQNRMYDVKRV